MTINEQEEIIRYKMEPAGKMTPELEEKFQLLHKRVRINLQASSMLLKEAKDLIAHDTERYDMRPTYDDMIALDALIEEIKNDAYRLDTELDSVDWLPSAMDC